MYIIGKPIQILQLEMAFNKWNTTSAHVSTTSSHVSTTSAHVSTTSVQVSATSAQVSRPELESNQNMYIATGTCCALLILLIIVITLCIIRVKKLKKDDGNRIKDEYEIETVSKNPYYESEQLEGGNMPNVNPYYEVNNVEIAEMSRNPYYETDEEGTPAVSVILMCQNPYYD